MEPILSRKAMKPDVISQSGMPTKCLWGTPAKKSRLDEGHSLFLRKKSPECREEILNFLKDGERRFSLAGSAPDQTYNCWKPKRFWNGNDVGFSSFFSGGCFKLANTDLASFALSANEPSARAGKRLCPSELQLCQICEWQEGISIHICVQANFLWEKWRSWRWSSKANSPDLQPGLSLRTAALQLGPVEKMAELGSRWVQSPSAKLGLIPAGLVVERPCFSFFLFVKFSLQ